jgi:integrase
VAATGAIQTALRRGCAEIGPLKTRASRRKVKLPRIALDALGEHLATKGVNLTAGDLVFPAPGGGLLSRTMFRQGFFVPACAAAGLDGLRVHNLRPQRCGPLDRQRCQP